MNAYNININNNYLSNLKKYSNNKSLFPVLHKSEESKQNLTYEYIPLDINNEEGKFYLLLQLEHSTTNLVKGTVTSISLCVFDANHTNEVYRYIFSSTSHQFSAETIESEINKFNSYIIDGINLYKKLTEFIDFSRFSVVNNLFNSSDNIFVTILEGKIGISTSGTISDLRLNLLKQLTLYYNIVKFSVNYINLCKTMPDQSKHIRGITITHIKYSGHVYTVVIFSRSFALVLDDKLSLVDISSDVFKGLLTKIRTLTTMIK